MTLITIAAADAVTIANLINLTDPKTPRLDVIHLDTALLETVAYGTDRYTLGRALVPSSSPLDKVEWRLTAAAAKFITANVKPVNKWHEPAPVTFDVNTEERTVTIAHGSSTFTDEWPADTFGRAITEQLAGVIDQWEPRATPDPVSLATRFLVKLGKLTDGFTKVDAWLLELGASPTHGNPAKPGPVRATAGRLELLIQPRLKN
jgi:hypothetical protein